MRKCQLLAHFVQVAFVLLLGPARSSAQVSFNALPSLEEVLGDAPEPIGLKLKNGRANYSGVMEEVREVKVRGKKSYMIFFVRLERGKTYQVDLHSKMFQAFLYLEDSDHNLLTENSSSAIGGNSRLVYKAEKAGVYRIIATSLGGFRTGPFVCSVREANLALLGADLPKELASWFDDLDVDRDGQVALYEWREGGRDLDEFRKYDLNDDGFITLDELIRFAKNQPKKKP